MNIFIINLINLFMRKSIFKLMSAAFALAAVTSCSDDLSLQSNKIDSNADLVAAFDGNDDVKTRLGMLEVEGANPWDQGSEAGWSWVFTENDKLRVFTMSSMEYQSYQLVAGAGTGEGEFDITAESPELPEGKQKYAITDAQFAYAVSPLPDGTPRLTYTIPYSYKARSFDVEGHADQAVQKLPAPFWGLAETVDKDGGNGGKILETSLWGLTAFLRIQMDQLPKGTKYIVLTTHGSEIKNDAAIEYDGFQLLTPDANNPVTAANQGKVKTGTTYKDFADNLNFWDTNATKITDGNSEPLSGTFNALLTAKGKVVNGENTGAYLAADEGIDEEGNEIEDGISRLVTRDEIVIDVTTLANDNIFWIPIIPQHYNNLHVLAVTYKSKYAYKYVGTELKNFHDDFFGVAKRRHLEMNMANFSSLNTAQLNEEIKKINNENKFKLVATNIINVDNLIDGTATWYADNYAAHGFTSAAAYKAAYPMDQILVQGKGNLVINIANIDQCTPGAKGNIYSPILNNVIADEGKTIFISDKNYGNGTGFKYATYTGIGASTKNSVKLNAPARYNGGVFAILADLPKTNAIFALNDNYAPAAQTVGKDVRIDVHGSATEFVNGHEVKDVTAAATGADATVKDSKLAAVTVQSGFGRLNVLEETEGDVYIDGTQYAQKVELADGFYIYTQDGTNVRMDNALSKNVGFPVDCNNNENYLITIGSSAIQNVGINKALGKVDAANPIEREYASATVLDPENQVPQDLTLLAYWTGYALDETADNIADYDKDIVYTAAQLASMGEKTANSTTNAYVVSSLLDYIWLGGESNGWVGPQVTVESFYFDGNGVDLLNMHMPENVFPGQTGMKRKVYAYDPHFCCTTCGWNRELDPDGTNIPKTELTSWGLIRSIQNTGANTVKNVVLNDVYANYPEMAVCDNIGSLVGLVSAQGSITFDNDNVGEIRINVPKNDFVGGFAGKIDAPEGVIINNSNAFNSNYETGYIKGKNYVGGMAGIIKGDRAANVSVTESQVILSGDISAAGHNAGGVSGEIKSDLAVFLKDKVKAANISAAESYAAGFVADLNGGTTSQSYFDDAVVDVEGNIIATAGQFAAGLVGYDKVKQLRVNSSDISAAKIQAEDGYVGGEVAYAYSGDVIFGRVHNTDIAYGQTQCGAGKKVNKVAVDELSGAYNVGGMVGNNANNANVTIYTAENATASQYSHTDVAIGTYSNTKSDLEAFFAGSVGSEQASHLAGTMSNIVGKVDGNLKINEKYLTVEDNLDAATKEAVGYKYRNDQQPTPGAATRFYWGDANGYVGFGKSGNYYLAETNSWTAADKVRGDMLDGNGFNLYKSEADYNTNSKLVTE